MAAVWQSCPRLLDEGLSKSGLSKSLILSYETYLKAKQGRFPTTDYFSYNYIGTVHAVQLGSAWHDH